MKTVPLGAVADLAARIGWHGLSTDDYRDEGDWLVAGTDFQAGTVSWGTCNRVEPGVWSRDPKIQLSRGDVLVTKDGTIGKIAHVGELPGRATLASGVFRVAHRQSLDSRYLYWLLNSGVMDEFQGRLGGGSTINHLYQRDFKSFPVPVIPGHEQRRIADFLDDQVTRIDHAIEHRQRQASLVEESFVTWLDAHLGAGRASLRLSNMTDPSRPIQYGIVLPGPDFDGGVPIVKGGDVAAHRMDPSLLSRTDPRIEAAYPRSRLVEGDLLIAIRGSVGELAKVPSSLAGANITQDAARIAPMGCDGVWLRWVLSTPTVQSRIASVVTGATVRGINIAELRRIAIPFVDPDEQDRLGRAAEVHAKRRDDLKARLVASIGLLRERKRSLVTAAVTGGLDVSSASSRAADVVVRG